jgi:pyrroloquinoline-quinone synthase
MMRIDCPRKRLSILENIVEEHGGFNQTRFHEATFLAFLEQLGATDHPTAVGMRPAVHAFNTSLMGVCTQGELAVGVACLGVIEFAFATISSVIAQAVTDQCWVSADKLLHYNLHAELDIAHAGEFFQLVACEWEISSKQKLVEEGLQLGSYLFDRLYRDLIVE